MNILIVDDDKKQLNGIVAIIKSAFANVRCLTASTFNDALSLLDSYIDIDVILLDIDLNGTKSANAVNPNKIDKTDETYEVDGIDLGRHIRALPQFKNTPVLFITGYAMEAARAIHATNCFDFLVKPFKPEDLIISIQKLIDMHIISEKPIRFRDIAGIYFRILPSEIIYMQCDDRNVHIHTISGNFTAHTSMKALIKNLPDFFVRCHKSYIVNIHYIINYDQTNLLIALRTQNRISIPIGATYYKPFIKKIRS